MKLEITTSNIVKSILVGLGVSSFFEIFDPVTCWAAENDLSESEGESEGTASYDSFWGVKDPSESPRGNFYFKLSAADVNKNDPIPFIFPPRFEHVLTDFYSVRQEIFGQLNLEVESLVKTDNPEQLVPSAKQRITFKLNSTYMRSAEAETVSLLESTSKYYKFQSFFESYDSRDLINNNYNSRNYWELHPNNLNEYNSNELNHALFKCISKSKIFKDPRFIDSLDSEDSD